MWIGIISITLIGRTADREKTVDLLEEYIETVTASISSFFGDAIDAASYLATVQGEEMRGWTDGGRGSYLLNLSA